MLKIAEAYCPIEISANRPNPMQKRFLGLTAVGAIALLGQSLIIAALSPFFISPALAQVRQITDVETSAADSGLIVGLELEQADQVTVLRTRFGNTVVLDLLVTQLAEGLVFFQDAPTDGVDSISVQPLDANSVRIRIVGSARTPTVIVNQDEIGIVLNIAPASRVNSISCRHCPDYSDPESASDGSTEGTVRVRVEFDAQGSVTGVEIIQSSGNASLDQAVLEAAMSWEFDTNGQGGSVIVESPLVIDERSRQEPQQ